MIFLEESLEEAQQLPPLGKRVMNLFSWAWQFTSSYRPSYVRLPHGAKGSKHAPHGGDATSDFDDISDDSDDESVSEISVQLLPESHPNITDSKLFNKDTILLLVTYMIFQLANISYNSLYPIFGQATPPHGRDLSPEELGVSLAFAGAATIVFQLGFFGKLREKMGNKVTYRVCLAAMALAFLLTPWVGYKSIKNGDGGVSNGKTWLWIELGIVLLIKSLAAVGCLTSFLLLVRTKLLPLVNQHSPKNFNTLYNVDGDPLLKLYQITNSAPNHSVLGTLNGIAQTLSAAGRAAGPILAGGLFSLATHVEPKGEALAFGVFGGVAFMGFLLTWGISGHGLEAEGFESDSEEEVSDDETEIGEETLSPSRR